MSAAIRGAGSPQASKNKTPSPAIPTLPSSVGVPATLSTLWLVLLDYCDLRLEKEFCWIWLSRNCCCPSRVTDALSLISHREERSWKMGCHSRRKIMDPGESNRERVRCLLVTSSHLSSDFSTKKDWALSQPDASTG